MGAQIAKENKSINNEMHVSDGVYIEHHVVINKEESYQDQKSTKIKKNLKVMTFNLLSERWIKLSHLSGRNLKQRIFDICYIIDRHSPDVALLQECDENMFDMIKKDKNDKYECLWEHCHNEDSSDGLAVLIRRECHYCLVKPS